MKTAFKWLGGLTGTLVVLALALAVQSWYFRPLVISVSTPCRRISARSRAPVPVIAAENPAEIDSTETNTITTPAMTRLDEMTAGGQIPSGSTGKPFRIKIAASRRRYLSARGAI